MDELPLHIGKKSVELRELRASIQRDGALWGWGTDRGLIPWEDREGRTMLVFWKSSERAIEENADEDAGPEEKPVRLTVDVLLEKLDGWAEAEVSVYGLESRNGRILYSLTPEEFADLLNGEPPGRRPLP
ncbi:hypothetical protein [Modestobacter sp. SYSU DS0875]